MVKDLMQICRACDQGVVDMHGVITRLTNLRNCGRGAGAGVGVGVGIIVTIDQ